MSVSYSTTECSVYYEYLAVKSMPFVFLTKIRVESHEDSDLELTTKNFHTSPNHLTDFRKSYETISTSAQSFTIIHSKAKTQSGLIETAIASSYLFLNG